MPAPCRGAICSHTRPTLPSPAAPKGLQDYIQLCRPCGTFGSRYATSFYRASVPAGTCAGDSAQRWRVSRNGARTRNYKGMGGGRKHLRIGTLLPTPPISPCSLRRAPPFRCERSERRNPLHSRQDLSRREYPLVPRKSQIVNRKSKKAVTLWRLHRGGYHHTPRTSHEPPRPARDGSPVERCGTPRT